MNVRDFAKSDEGRKAILIGVAGSDRVCWFGWVMLIWIKYAGCVRLRTTISQLGFAIATIDRV